MYGFVNKICHLLFVILYHVFLPISLNGVELSRNIQYMYRVFQIKGVRLSYIKLTC